MSAVTPSEVSNHPQHMLELLLYFLYAGIGGCVICHFIEETMEPVLRRFVLDWCGGNSFRLRNEAASEAEKDDRSTLADCSNQNSHTQHHAIMYSQERQERSCLV